MTTEYINLIKTLADTIGETASEVVTHYAFYHFFQAAAFIALGLVIVRFGMKLTYNDDISHDVPRAFQSFFKYGIIFVGLLFVVANFPDLLSPKAIAIHQLISDLTPSK